MNKTLQTLMAIATFSSYCQTRKPVLIRFSFEEMNFTIFCGECGTLSISEEKITFANTSNGHEYNCLGDDIDSLLRSNGFVNIFSPLYKVVSEEALKITKELLTAKVASNQRFIKKHNVHGKYEEIFFVHDYGIQSAIRESHPFMDFIKSENFLMNKLLQCLETYSLEILMEAQFNPKEFDEILIPVFQDIESTWTSLSKYEA